MTRKTVLALSIAALLAGVVYVSPTPDSFAAEPVVAVKQAPPAIRVVAAERRELVETLSVTGTIVAREEAAAGTDLNGMIVSALNADQGDMVTKGEILAVLDRSALDTQIAQMDASRAQAEANIAQAGAQIADTEIGVRQAGEALERARSLHKKGVVTQAQLDNAVNAADSARAKLVSAQKAMASSEAQLAVIDAQRQSVTVQIAKTEVRAPADGIVLARSATLGGIVSGSSGPMFRIAIGAQFELAADVAETALPRLALGMKTNVLLAGATAPIEGNIRRISPEIDQKSRLGAIRVALAPNNTARAGSFARGEIETMRREGVAAPASAIIFRGEQPFLQLVEDGKVTTAAVTLGARAGDQVEILSGVTQGQEVVSRAGTFVADGDEVTPVRGDSTGAIQP